MSVARRRAGHLNGKFNSSSSWGLDTQGRPFSHHAQAESVSDHNALLGGRHSPLAIGSVFELQWQDEMHSRGRFFLWCIFAHILRRTRFGSAVAVESNEA
jgi:hypothetical protein